MLNENLGGHATMHLNIYRALAEHPEVDLVALDIPPRSFARRLVGVRVPGLRQPRPRSRAGPRAARASRPPRAGCCAPRSRAVRSVRSTRTRNTSRCGRRRSCAAYPSVVSTDGSAAQNAVQLPFRRPGRFTPSTARVGEHFEERVFDAATIVVAQSEWCAERDPRSLRPRPRPSAGHPVRHHPAGTAPPVERRSRTRCPRSRSPATRWTARVAAALLRAFRSPLRGQCVLNLVTPEPVPPDPGCASSPTSVPAIRAWSRCWRGRPSSRCRARSTSRRTRCSRRCSRGCRSCPRASVGSPRWWSTARPGSSSRPATKSRSPTRSSACSATTRCAPRWVARLATRAHERFDARKTTADLIGVIAEARSRTQREPDSRRIGVTRSRISCHRAERAMDDRATVADLSPRVEDGVERAGSGPRRGARGVAWRVGPGIERRRATSVSSRSVRASARRGRRRRSSSRTPKKVATAIGDPSRRSAATYASATQCLHTAP